MKRAVVILGETVLFLALFFIGSFLPVFHLLPLWSIDVNPARYFVLDGPLLMLLLYTLLLILGGIRRRLSMAAITATAALVFAVVLGLAMKFGFATR
ncbi:MAG TPA: hypothetical protein VM865_02540 [Acidobacteriaceae bacterium]|jgi:hypothetical protein|nr:hypothetical protein [Acidobacteriaceae bacterium]